MSIFKGMIAAQANGQVRAGTGRQGAQLPRPRGGSGGEGAASRETWAPPPSGGRPAGAEVTWTETGTGPRLRVPGPCGSPAVTRGDLWARWRGPPPPPVTRAPRSTRLNVLI